MMQTKVSLPVTADSLSNGNAASSQPQHHVGHVGGLEGFLCPARIAIADCSFGIDGISFSSRRPGLCGSLHKLGELWPSSICNHLLLTCFDSLLGILESFDGLPTRRSLRLNVGYT